MWGTVMEDPLVQILEFHPVMLVLILILQILEHNPCHFFVMPIERTENLNWFILHESTMMIQWVFCTFQEKNRITFEDVVVHHVVIVPPGTLRLEIYLENCAAVVELFVTFFGCNQLVLLTNAVHVVVNHRLKQLFSWL
jgi:hypothetical protein